MKVAVIGANRGIGLEFCKQLTQQGHEVYAFCRKSSSELDNLKTAQVIENCETSSESSLKDSVEKMNADQLDWLVHVAGIMRPESLDNFNTDTIVEQFKVNSIGPILSAKVFLPKLSKGSKIGLLTSRMGSIADNTSGSSYGYRMSKTALNMAGVSLSQDIKEKDITVLLLHPGYVRTDMTGGSGMIDTDESVQGLLKILNDKTMEHTGTFWHTNGEQLPW